MLLELVHLLPGVMNEIECYYKPFYTEQEREEITNTITREEGEAIIAVYSPLVQGLIERHMDANDYEEERENDGKMKQGKKKEKTESSGGKKQEKKKEKKEGKKEVKMETAGKE
jgi:hypothetical protein